MIKPVTVFVQKLFSEITEVPLLLQYSHLPSLDGLRGVSIIMVLIYHMLLANNYSGFNGIFGVNVFFVISGFLITTLLLKEKLTTGDISLGKFYMRRFLKIVPLAWCYLLVVVLLNSYYKFVALPDILSAAVFLKNTNIIPTHWDAATGHFWSLSVEEQFYIALPFVLKKSTNGYLAVLLILIVVIPVALGLEYRNSSIFSTGGMHIFLDFFRYITPILTGALFALLVFKKVITKRLFPNNLTINLLILFIAYLIYNGAGFLSGLYYKTFISSALVAILIVNNISHSPGLFYRLLNSKAFVTVGMASYSIYVWQQIFLLWRPWEHIFGFAGAMWLDLLTLFVVSFCSYYFIEKKLALIKKRFR